MTEFNFTSFHVTSTLMPAKTATVVLSGGESWGWLIIAFWGALSRLDSELGVSRGEGLAEMGWHSGRCSWQVDEGLEGAANHQAFTLVLVRPALQLSSVCPKWLLGPQANPWLQGIAGEGGTTGEHWPQQGGWVPICHLGKQQHLYDVQGGLFE